MYGWIWHGAGVVGLLVGLWLVDRVVRILRGQPGLRVLYATGIGFISGAAGVACGLLTLLWLDAQRLSIAATSDATLAARALLVLICMELGAFLSGRLAGRLARTICPEGAVVRIALVTGIVLCIYPVVWGWGLDILSALQ